MSSPPFLSLHCSALNISDNSREKYLPAAPASDYYFTRHRRNCTLLLSLPSISFFASAVIKSERGKEEARINLAVFQ